MSGQPSIRPPEVQGGGEIAEIDPLAFRAVLGNFASGVAVITTCDAEGKYHGVTVSSFSSLSLSPPLILWSLRCAARAHSTFCDASYFAVNILASEQEALSQRFGGADDPFAGIPRHRGGTGVPLLDGALAWLECAHEVAYPGGDHTIIVGRVLAAQHHDRQPLLHWRGRYRQLGS